MTKNWKDIHPEFTEELQRVWEKEFSGFYDSYKRCKEYIDKGLRPEEAEFAKYLWQQGYYSDGSGQWAGEDAEEIAKKVKELRAERILWKNIGNFVSEMTKQLQGQGLIPGSGSQLSEEDCLNEKWKSKGFDAEEREKWIKIGLKPDEYEIAYTWKNLAGLSVEQVEEWVKLGLPPQDLKFACYLIKVKGYSPQQNLDLKQLREKFNNPPAQEYLDSYFPKEKRKDRRMLSMSQENLTEALDLREFANLEELNSSDNYLQDLKLPFQTENLVELDLKNNDLAERDLSVFQELVNLKYLLIGNTNQEKIKKGIYNRFVGSLEPLKNLTKLSQLDIDNTDLNGGVEYLPENLSGADNRTWRKISYSTYERPESKIKEIKWQLDLFTSEKQKEWEKLGFRMDEIKQWMTFSPKRKIWVDDYYLVGYLRHKGYTPRLGLDLTKLRREYNEELKKQKWFWESEASEAVLFRRWKKTNLKEQINSLEDEYEIIEKSDEGKTEVEKKEQTAQILQPANQPYGIPGSSK